MGDDKIRHLQTKAVAGGRAYFWTPSPSLRALGMAGEALGTNGDQARAKALALNAWADEMRNGGSSAEGIKPGSVARLFRDYRQSEEFVGVPGEPELPGLKPRTQKDYTYYLGKIEPEFGHLPVTAMSARVIKEYYKRVRCEKGITWAYHIMGALRAAFSWGVSEDWIPKNPALDVTVTSPRKRLTIWEPDQAITYIEKATELGWHSIAAMATIFDCIGQSPIDVRMLRRRGYNGKSITITRSKTGVRISPVPLWPDAKQALDDYLATRPALLPDAFVFVNDRIGLPWVESTLHKTHNEIRTAAGLPKKLQLQDFRRTAQTEAGAAGGTVDEIRALAQHSTRTAGEFYVHPDERFAAAVQDKRLAMRNKKARKSE